jgi:DHA2 family multidrug resistance protein
MIRRPTDGLRLRDSLWRGMTDTTDNPAAEMEIGASRRILILISTMLSVAVYFSSILVASTVLPQMQGSFSATPDEVSWTMTFNILATAIAMPMTGWLTARFGRSTVMIWATGTFTIATALCGFATTLEEQILWRVVQGAAGAPCVPLAQTILLDTFPPRQHRMVLGVYGMGVVLGPIIGPMLGGYLAEILNWRWAFFLLIPVGVAATIGLSATLPPDRERGPAYLSWIGFILLSVAIGGLQLALSRGQRLDWFESTEIRVTLFVSAVSFYLFLAHSLTSRRPFLDLRLLLVPNYSVGLALIAIFGMLNFVPMVLLPPLMRVYMGFPDVLIGQVVGARGLGGLLGFFAVIFLSRLDPRISVGAGFVLQFVAGLWLMRIDLNVTPLELALNGVIQGLSAGVIVVALSLVTFANVPRERMPEATAMFHLLRNIGASLFISVCVAEVVRSTGANYSLLSEPISSFNRTLSLPWVVGPLDMSSPISLARLSREISRQAAMIAHLNAFGLFTAAAAVSLPLALLLRNAKKV